MEEAYDDFEIEAPDDLDLDEAQQAVLAQLENPDQGVGAQYAWDEEFQRRLLSMMLNDRMFLVQVAPLIDPHYFTNEVHQLTSRLLTSYFEKHRSLPEPFFMTQEVEDSISQKPAHIKNHYKAELTSTYNFYKPGVGSRDALRDKVVEFAKVMSMKVAFQKCLNLIKKDTEEQDTWSQVYEILNTAMSVDHSFDGGQEYFLEFKERYKRVLEAQANGEIFTTGYESLDKGMLAGGPMRGEIYSVMGMPGTGKSLMLVHMACANILLGRKVLYISTEMSEDKIAQRFDAQLLQAAYNDFSINSLYDHQDEVFTEFQNIFDDNDWGDDKNRLVIKQFPAGVMDVPMLRSYYKQLYLRGFQPDIVIVDYIGEMRDHPKIPTHESRFRIVRDLRGFAVEEQILLLTAMQPNRSGRDVQILTEIDDEHLGDSYAQARPLDGLLSINQTNDQKEAGLGRIFVVKLRDGRSRYRFFVDFDHKTLKITEIPFDVYKPRWTEFMHNKKEEIASSTMDGDAAEYAKAMKAQKKAASNVVEIES